MRAEVSATPINYRDASGAPVMTFATPTMTDAAGASGPVTMTLVPGTLGDTVTVTADTTWLASPSRQWPVIIDPTTQIVTSKIQSDTQLSSNIGSAGQANNSLDTIPMYVGADPTWPNSFDRGLLEFNLTSIPATAQILSANLDLDAATLSRNPLSIGIYQFTRAWTTNCTWNDYDGTNPWNVPGGDFNATPADVQPVGGTSPTPIWHPLALVRQWVSGAVPNDGIIVKETAESGTGVVTMDATKQYLTIIYAPWTGAQSFQSFKTISLGDRLSLGYNVAKGDEKQIATPNRMFSGSNLETYTYNNSGELTQIKGTHFNTTINSYSYSYVDPNTGKLSALRYSMTDAAGDVTSYTYDQLDQLTHATEKRSGGTTLNDYGYSYDPVVRPVLLKSAARRVEEGTKEQPMS